MMSPLPLHRILKPVSRLWRMIHQQAGHRWVGRLRAHRLVVVQVVQVDLLHLRFRRPHHQRPFQVELPSVCLVPSVLVQVHLHRPERRVRPWFLHHLVLLLVPSAPALLLHHLHLLHKALVRTLQDPVCPARSQPEVLLTLPQVVRLVPLALLQAAVVAVCQAIQEMLQRLLQCPFRPPRPCPHHLRPCTTRRRSRWTLALIRRRPVGVMLRKTGRRVRARVRSHRRQSWKTRTKRKKAIMLLAVVMMRTISHRPHLHLHNPSSAPQLALYPCPKRLNHPHRHPQPSPSPLQPNNRSNNSSNQVAGSRRSAQAQRQPTRPQPIPLQPPEQGADTTLPQSLQPSLRPPPENANNNLSNQSLQCWANSPQAVLQSTTQILAPPPTRPHPGSHGIRSLNFKTPNVNALTPPPPSAATALELEPLDKEQRRRRPIITQHSANASKRSSPSKPSTTPSEPTEELRTTTSVTRSTSSTSPPPPTRATNANNSGTAATVMMMDSMTMTMKRTRTRMAVRVKDSTVIETRARRALAPQLPLPHVSWTRSKLTLLLRANRRVNCMMGIVNALRFPKCQTLVASNSNSIKGLRMSPLLP
ncbi:MAG: hypothetical protein JOS17DRAFT_177291 [Linnemannia elongata]|nr:MAG: hypothetical protein JOS17DRAFT_177291 [Linnemannia elongata]